MNYLDMPDSKSTYVDIAPVIEKYSMVDPRTETHIHLIRYGHSDEFPRGFWTITLSLGDNFFSDIIPHSSVSPIEFLTVASLGFQKIMQRRNP